MTRLLCFIIILSIISSCKPEYKKCEFQTNDNILKAYNDILNEIVSKHSYNLYLGKDEEKVFERYATNLTDSADIDKDVIKLHNKLFGDTSKFCTIYLDTILRPEFNQWSYFKNDTNQFSRTVRSLINNLHKDGQTVIDSLNSVQTKYLSSDFQICIAKIKSVRELNTDKPSCYIGKISFSKLALNQTNDKGLLYYEFKCGALCGYGRLVMIEKVQNDWKIIQSLTTWVS
jgi:hypothetical protein